MAHNIQVVVADDLAASRFSWRVMRVDVRSQRSWRFSAIRVVVSADPRATWRLWSSVYSGWVNYVAVVLASLNGSVMVRAWTAFECRLRWFVRRGRFDLAWLGVEGEVRQPLMAAAGTAFEYVAPVREFPSYRGQRHFPGRWWSATDGSIAARLHPEARGVVAGRVIQRQPKWMGRS